MVMNTTTNISADLCFAPSGGDMNAHPNAATTLANAGSGHITADDDVGWQQKPFFESGFLGPAL